MAASELLCGIVILQSPGGVSRKSKKGPICIVGYKHVLWTSGRVQAILVSQSYNKQTLASVHVV